MSRRTGTRTNPNPKAQMVLGVMVVVIGLLFLVDNLGWIHLDFRRLLVPTVLLLAGVLKLTHARSNSGNVIGVVLVCVGSIGILRGIGFLDFDWRDIWPVLLIIAGIGIVYKASIASNGGSSSGSGDWSGSDRSGGSWSGGDGSRSDGSGSDGSRSDGSPSDGSSSDGPKASFQAPSHEPFKAPRGGEGDEVINFVSVVGSSNRRVTSQNFRGGEVTAILGGADLDLRQASIQGEAVLNVFSLAGGITIKVPVDWTVVMEGTAIIGGFEEKTAPPSAGGKRLVLRGYSILGGLEVRN